MNFQANIQVGALFKLIVHKGNPEQPSKETSLFHNLVLDAGLDRLSVGSAINRVCVGSGNSAPVVTQTALDAFIASTTTTQGSDISGTQVATSPYYYWVRRTYRFGEGIAAGNLSELGIGWSNTNLFNRALIKDANSNPTTITVLADEFLDVVVELRLYPKMSFTNSFNLLDKLGNIISTHTVTGMPLFATAGSLILGPVSICKDQNGDFKMFSGDMGAGVNVYPAGTEYITSSANITISYPSGRSCKAQVKFPLNLGNGTHRSFFAPVKLVSNGAHFGYKCQIDPPIYKNNTQEIQYSFTLNWDRYVP